jgi:hypothetical protein
VNSRKIAALEALAESGATEGEREAARNALEKERAKLRAKEPPRPSAPPPPFTRPDWQRNDVAYAAFLNGLFARAHGSRRRSAARTYDIQFEPSSAPRVTQMRQATLADFRDTLTAYGDENAPELLIEVSKEAQAMYWRESAVEHLVAWRGLIWKTSRFCGLRNDHGDGKHYLKVNRKDLKPMMVPA